MSDFQLDDDDDDYNNNNNNYNNSAVGIATGYGMQGLSPWG
jgi:hypothetical protein